MGSRTGPNRIPLSSALVNAFGHSGQVSKSSGSASAGQADSRASGFMQVSPAARANQDFGFYQTGNGQLFRQLSSSRSGSAA